MLAPIKIKFPIIPKILKKRSSSCFAESLKKKTAKTKAVKPMALMILGFLRKYGK